MTDSMNRSTVLVPVLAALVLAGVWLSILPRSGAAANTLVVYCAHDRVFAEQVLDDFTRQTGIRVQTRFDTEATKSLGLINLIVQERQQPRCDVFWNNELLGMVELREQGLLEPHHGSGWRRMPERYRDADGHWVGFAARLRVYIVNARQVSATAETLHSLFTLEPARVAIANPLFGTTLTHYTVLWHLWGPDRLQEWHRDLRLRGLREMDGNAAVKDIVARGTCDAGLTDTDDVFVALDDGLPVEMLPVRLAAATFSPTPIGSVAFEQRQRQDSAATIVQEASDTSDRIELDSDRVLPSVTICIPNTVGIIKGTKRLEAARRLIDFLASAETELALAQSKSRQIPLGPVDQSQLSDEVQRLTEWSRDGIDLRSLLPARRECLKWLKLEYLK